MSMLNASTLSDQHQSQAGRAGVANKLIGGGQDYCHVSACTCRRL